MIIQELIDRKKKHVFLKTKRHVNLKSELVNITYSYPLVQPMFSYCFLKKKKKGLFTALKSVQLAHKVEQTRCQQLITSSFNGWTKHALEKFYSVQTFMHTEVIHMSYFKLYQAIVLFFSLLILPFLSPLPFPYPNPNHFISFSHQTLTSTTLESANWPIKMYPNWLHE